MSRINLSDDDDGDELRNEVLYTIARTAVDTILDVIQVKAEDQNDAMVGLNELVEDMRKHLRLRYARRTMLQ